MAPLLPKLRGHFAEFLNHSSLDRLGILYLTTCVGLGYGPQQHSLEAFLGSIGSSTSPQSARHRVSGHVPSGFTWTTPYTLTPGQPPPGLDYLPASPHHLPTTTLDRRLHHSPQLRRDQGGFTALALMGSILGVSKRVPEYQPVVHRLRLSASP